MSRLANRCLTLLYAATLVSLNGATAQVIQGVHMYRSAEAQANEVSGYLEIDGQGFPSGPDLHVFVAPDRGLTGQPQIVSASGAMIVVKIISSSSYAPSTIGVAGPGGVVTFDVPPGSDATIPRIDAVEVLQLNRQLGLGRIKIEGKGFGSDPARLTASIVPRNPSLPAFAPVAPNLDQDTSNYTCPSATPEQQKLLPAIQEARDDEVIVGFSFPCTPGYSSPFRIANVILTVATSPNAPSTTITYEMAPQRDKNLIYRYTILSTTQASSRFGGGIAKNFYVLQLSIINKGPVKMQVPLASIQADVEWAAGSSDDKYYLEGPATVSPVPLPGAVSFFSEHRKSSGPRAILFNTLQGLTTVGSAVELFFGHGFAQGVGIAGGGFRQGLGQIFQDLSDEQLANLTSQSFNAIESVSGNGGSLEKVIFIQRGEEIIQSSVKTTKFRRLISNILDLQITGYEVPESAAKSGTPES